MTETGTDPGAASVGTWYAEAKKEADRRAHKAKRAAEQEAKASADVGHGR